MKKLKLAWNIKKMNVDKIILSFIVLNFLFSFILTRIEPKIDNIWKAFGIELQEIELLKETRYNPIDMHTSLWYRVEIVSRGSSKMRVLFATTNPAKIKKYAEKLKENNIEVLTIKDLGINLKPEETGKNAIENAYLKAKAYYDKTKITTIGMDNNLYIEELPEEKQPGTHVRRVNGKELNDDEMIEYYCNLVKEYGGKLTAKWVYGMVIYDGKEPKEYSWNKSHFYFVDKPCKKRNPGYPLDSMSIMPECNKYFVDLTEEDRNKDKENYSEDDVIDFIINNIESRSSKL